MPPEEGNGLSVHCLQTLEIVTMVFALGAVYTLSRSLTHKGNPFVTQTFSTAVVTANVLIFFTVINIVLLVLS